MAVCRKHEFLIKERKSRRRKLKNSRRIEKENARLEAQKSVFAAPPNGSTRISLNRGFDKCTAATVAQMQIWWNTSPFYDANIYMSGRNRGCSAAAIDSGLG
ncbi:MAG: hypothetical protein WKF71_00165 [Pyrinomonadaceae bacterium]